jgi:hypothetical protein
MFKILFFIALIGYFVYRFGRKIYQVARIIAGVGDAIAQKQAQQQAKNTPKPPHYHDKENNIKVYSSDKKKHKDFSDGEYIDYEDVK